MSDLMSSIKDLRQITGAGFLDCKKALEENNQDIEISIDFLRKKGLAKAGKKSSREAKEGAVGIYSNEKFTSIIQINTETDFAAKNDIFLDFMDSIGDFSLQVENSSLSLDGFNNLKFENILISDHFKNIIAKIGENIVLSKLILIDNSESTIISKYIHNTYRKNIGKIVVTLEINADKNNENSKLLGKNLCMHIAASKPLSMNLKDLDPQLISKEKEVQLETIKASGYILDSDKTIENVVSDFSKDNNFAVVSYNLITLGS